MLEFFTGKVPFFYIPHDAMVIAMILDGEFPRRPDDDRVVARGLDESMWQLMMDCWHAMPSERPSAADLVSRLAAALDLKSASTSVGAEGLTTRTLPREDSFLGDSPRRQQNGPRSILETRLRSFFGASKRGFR
ncbi:hypothetical protein BOTBODRAFT_512465 [Botryobasidium botryosum FD-172 SS1]|uniref:Serine-threonine/tyrosine-protein kinase catalytic domain-containing protein n=1 Tax=Botryobasidium botryosum (strain FD-172 SS1) TaxID=930990 RepID=A0A067MUS8_BOTB1|nr:hypothetical protein BOTBODRAFT_512465 [Botryobasidium botryosum FD-172 SS1]